MLVSEVVFKIQDFKVRSKLIARLTGRSVFSKDIMKLENSEIEFIKNVSGIGTKTLSIFVESLQNFGSPITLQVDHKHQPIEIEVRNNVTYAKCLTCKKPLVAKWREYGNI